MPVVRIQKQFDHPSDFVDVERRRLLERDVNWFTPALVGDLPAQISHLPANHPERYLNNLDHMILAREKDPYEIAIIRKEGSASKNKADNTLSFYNYEVRVITAVTCSVILYKFSLY